MNQTRLLHPGSFTKIFAELPRHGMYAPIIAGDPSAKGGPQNDSVRVDGIIISASCVMLTHALWASSPGS